MTNQTTNNVTDYTINTNTSALTLTANPTIPAGEVPDRVLVMKEGAEVRAIACSDDEAQARLYPGSLGTPFPSYDIMMVDPASIRKEEIVMPAPRTAPTVSTDLTTSARRSD